MRFIKTMMNERDRLNLDLKSTSLQVCPIEHKCHSPGINIPFYLEMPSDLLAHSNFTPGKKHRNLSISSLTNTELISALSATVVQQTIASMPRPFHMLANNHSVSGLVVHIDIGIRSIQPRHIQSNVLQCLSIAAELILQLPQVT